MIRLILILFGIAFVCGAVFGEGGGLFLKGLLLLLGGLSFIAAFRQSKKNVPELKNAPETEPKPRKKRRRRSTVTDGSDDPATDLAHLLEDADEVRGK